MKFRGPIVASLFVCSALLFFAVAARSADESGGASSAPTELFKWINFVIVAAALIWLCGKALPPAFRANAGKISSTITKAQAAKTEADRKLRDAEQRLARLQEEVRGLREQALKEAAAEAERIRAMAKSTDAEENRHCISAKAEIEAAERASAH